MNVDTGGTVGPAAVGPQLEVPGAERNRSRRCSSRAWPSAIELEAYARKQIEIMSGPAAQPDFLFHRSADPNHTNLWHPHRLQEDLVMTAKKRLGQQIAKRYPPYLLARQIAALKRLSDDTETPVQYHIRQAIDEYLERRKKTQRGRSS